MACLNQLPLPLPLPLPRTQAVDIERTGWLSFAHLERVLIECEMLPGQAPPEIYDDVLLAVWAALSRVDPFGGSGSSSDGDGNDARDDNVRFGRKGRRKACGVAVESLSALLTGVACRSYGYETNDSACLPASPQKTGRKPFSSNPANSRLWGNDEEERGRMCPEPGAFATTVPQCNEQLEDLCEGLSDIFLTNQRHRVSRQQEESRANKSDQAGERRTRCRTEVHGSSPRGVARDNAGAPPTVATPAQVAATTARFEEKIRARERKIDLLRRAREAQNILAHPFEPTMATTSTPQAAAVRRKTAGCGGRRNGVIGEGQQPKKAVIRTTEERELDDNCTFQPRLFRPLPMPPPRYPIPKTTHGRGGGETGKYFTSSSDEASPTASAVDRATASWEAQVDRLRTGRRNHLRRLEEKQAIESRGEPLPPSVQQLFFDAGIEACPQGQNIVTPGGGATATKQVSGCSAKKKGSNTRGGPFSRNLSSSPPRLRLEARLRVHSRLKEKRSEEQARKNAEENARRQKQKRLLARARKKSAAVVGLEAALSAREAERGRPSWSDPPILIADVEFVRQKWWILLPLWADTCPREAVSELAKQQQGAFVGTVAADLEISFRDEMRRVCEETTGLVGLEHKQEALEGENAARGGNDRRTVPTVVLRVDAADEPLRDTACVH